MTSSSAPTRRVVLIGGGFSLAMDDLDTYLFSVLGKDCPTVTWLGTASGDDARYIVRFHNAMREQGATSQHVSLFDTVNPRMHDLIEASDAVYVGGGSTANMLALWRLHGLDTTLRRAYEQGTLLAGISAGANCWFEECSTDSFGPVQPLKDGLGILPGSFVPHYNTEESRRPGFHDDLAAGRLGDGYALDDGAAMLFTDEQLTEVVTRDGEATAYRVTAASDAPGWCETALPATRLPS